MGDRGGVYLTPEDAEPVAAALRGLAGIIRSTPWDQPDMDPDHLDHLANTIRSTT